MVWYGMVWYVVRLLDQVHATPGTVGAFKRSWRGLDIIQVYKKYVRNM